MPTASDWIAGARPRTLPAAVAPVLAGTGVAAYVDGAVWWKAVLALVVRLALQVAVNYANDYSDGIRGTDDDRVGPMRLVGSGRATPGGEAGGVRGLRRRRGRRAGARRDDRLVAGRGRRRLRRWPRGSTPAATSPTATSASARSWSSCSSAWSPWSAPPTCRPRRFELPALYAAIGIGALACAILVVNNLRDIPTDTVVRQAHAGGPARRGAHPRPLPAARPRRRGGGRRGRGEHDLARAARPRLPGPGRSGAADRAGRRPGPGPGPGAPADRVAEMVWALGVVVGLA